MAKQGKLNWLPRSAPLSSAPLPVPPPLSLRRKKGCALVLYATTLPYATAVLYATTLPYAKTGVGWGRGCAGGNAVPGEMRCGN